MPINFRDIVLVAQRELRHYLRDPHVLIYSILLPALLYPTVVVLMIEGGMWQESLAQKKGLSIGIGKGLSSEANLFVGVLKKTSGIKLVNAEDPIALLKNGELQAVVEAGVNGATTICLPPAAMFDAAPDRTKLQQIVEDFQQSSLKDLLAKKNMTPDQLTAFLIRQTNVSKFSMSLTYIMPYVCCLALVMMDLGAIYPAISAFTEEREKKTLESTLTLPLDRLTLVLGKHSANSLITLASSLLNLVCILSVVALMGSLPQAQTLQLSKNAWFTLPQFVTVAVVFVTTAAEISALYLLLSQFAKTFREAQNILTLPAAMSTLLLVIILSPTLTLNLSTSLVPVFNSFVVCKAVFSNNVPWSFCLIAVSINLAITGGLLFMLSKIVAHEQFGFSQFSLRKLIMVLKENA